MRENMTSHEDTWLDIGAVMMNFDAIASQRDNIDWTMGAPADIAALKIPEEYEVAAYYDWE